MGRLVTYTHNIFTTLCVRRVTRVHTPTCEKSGVLRDFHERASKVSRGAHRPMVPAFFSFSPCSLPRWQRRELADSPHARRPLPDRALRAGGTRAMGREEPK